MDKDGIVFRLCQWLHFIVRQKDAHSLLGIDDCNSLEIQITEITSILFREEADTHRRGTATNTSWEKETQTLALSRLLTIIESFVENFSKCLLLHFCVINCSGGENDIFLSLLKSFWSSIDSTSNRKNMQGAVESHEYPVKPRKETTKDWKKKTHSGETGSNELVQSNNDTLHSSSPEDTAQQNSITDEQRLFRSHVGNISSRNENRKLQYTTARDQGLQSVESIMLSILSVLQLVCDTLFPVIVWTYLSRSIHPVSKSKPDNNDDDILGLQAIIVKALEGIVGVRESLSTNTSRNLRILLGINNSWDGIMRNMPPSTPQEATPSCSNVQQDYHINFNLIASALRDEHILSTSKDKTNPYLESAMTTVASLATNNETCDISKSSQSLTVGMRESFIEGQLLSCIQWTDRIRPWMTLQALRLIRQRVLPDFNENLAIQQFLDNQNMFQTSKTITNTKYKYFFPGYFICLSVLHRLAFSIASFEFESICTCFKTNSSLQQPLIQPHDVYRCIVDDETMVEVCLLLFDLQQYQLKHLNKEDCKTSDNGNSDVILGHMRFVIDSLSSSSFQQTYKTCLLRCQYEILPRSTLMLAIYMQQARSKVFIM